MKNNTKKSRGAAAFFIGIIGALAGPWIGWVLSGLCPVGFDRFLQNYPEKVVVYAIIGFLVGIVAGALLLTLDNINQREKEDDGKTNRT